MRYSKSPKSGTADLVIDGVGHAATRATACELAKPGGVILYIGFGSGEGGVDVRRMTLQEITFIVTYTYVPQDFKDTDAAIFAGRFGPIDWVETRSLSEGQFAVDDIWYGRTPAPKKILIP